MNIDYDKEDYTSEEINDFLLHYVKQGDSHGVRKTLQYFAHTWLTEDFANNLNNNPVVESFLNLDKSCFEEFKNHFGDVEEWSFDTKENDYFEKLNLFEVALDAGATQIIEDFIEFGYQLNTKSLTVLFKNNSAKDIKNILEIYKEKSLELNVIAPLFPNLLKEQLRNLFMDLEVTYKEKNELVQEWKELYKEKFSISYIQEVFLANSFLNCRFFDEIEDNSLKEKIRENFDRCIFDFTGMDYKEFLSSSLPRIFESRASLNTMERLLSEKELEEVIENYFISLPRNNSFKFKRVADSLINLIDNGFNKLLKKHDLKDFVYGENGFLPFKYSKTENIENDSNSGVFITYMESLILKKEIINIPKDNLTVRKRI